MQNSDEDLQISDITPTGQTLYNRHNSVGLCLGYILPDDDIKDNL